MKLKRFIKRIAALSLATAMVATLLPTNLTVKAGPNDYPDEVYFPISILDVPSDGLFFECAMSWNGNYESHMDDLGKNQKYGEQTYAKGLVADSLQTNSGSIYYGLPVYKKSSVDYLAQAVQDRLKQVLNTSTTNNVDRMYVNGTLNPISARTYIKPEGCKVIDACDEYFEAEYTTPKTFAADDIGTEVGGSTNTNSPYNIDHYTKRENGAIVQGGKTGCLKENNVGYIGGPKNGKVTFYYDLKKSDHYYISVYFCCASNRTLGYSVNDGTHQTAANLNSGSWDNPGTGPLIIDAGTINGTLKLVLDGDGTGAYAPDIDRIEINNYEPTGGKYSTDVQKNKTYPLGSYQASMAKYNIARTDDDGNATSEGKYGYWDIETCYDYAYFVTANMYKSNPTYNKAYTAYNNLIFHKVEETVAGGEKKTYYEFQGDSQHGESVDGGAGGQIFNPSMKTIRNGKKSDVDASKGEYRLPGGSMFIADGDAAYTGDIIETEAEEGIIRLSNPNFWDPKNSNPGDGYVHIAGWNNGYQKKFTVPEAGTYDLIAYYKNGQNSGSNFTVAGGNKVSADIKAAQTMVCYSGLKLKAGDNTLTFEGQNVEFDKFVLRKVVVGTGVKKNIDLDPPETAADGLKHNFHFTVHTHSRFVYKEGADQYFFFSGDDDVYVFVNGKLLVDLGGQHGEVSDEFHLDDMAEEAKTDPSKDYGLVNEQTVDFDFFYVERHATSSNFWAKMSFQLKNDDASLIWDEKVKNQEDGLTIPYGYLIPLDYSFTTQRQLTTNDNITFTDKLGNTIGKEDFKLGEGVTLGKNSEGKYVLTVTVTRDKGSPVKAGTALTETEVFEFSDEKASIPAEVQKVKDYFANLRLAENDKVVINGLFYDTATKAFTDETAYTAVAGDPSIREMEIETKATYMQTMDMGTGKKDDSIAIESEAFKNETVKVIVGELTVSTSVEDENLKKDLSAYGKFTITRLETTNPNLKTIYTNDFRFTGTGDKIVFRAPDRPLPRGTYQLNMDVSMLTGYKLSVTTRVKDPVTGTVDSQEHTTKVVNGKEEYDFDSLILELEPQAVKVGEKKVWDSVAKKYKTENVYKWKYPEVEYILKAVREVNPLKDLT